MLRPSFERSGGGRCARDPRERCETGGTRRSLASPQPGGPRHPIGRRLEASHDPLRGHPGDRPAPPPGGGPRDPPQGLHLLGGRAQGTGAGLRRALPRPPPRGGQPPGRDADGPDLRRGRACSTTSSRTPSPPPNASRSTSGRTSCTSSRASPRSRRSPTPPPRSDRPRPTARCSWRWWTTSASSSSSSPIASTTCAP